MSGLASLDGSSKVVQNPASGTSTPGADKIIMSDGTGKANDNWLSDNITKLGTPTTDNISEGSTNKYYTDARVNAAVGSLSVNVHSDSNINMNNENDFVKIVGGQLVAGSSSVTVAFPEVTGSATSAQMPADPVISGNLYVSGIVGGTTTGALKIPSGTTAQRPASPEVGMIRYNTTTNQMEMCSDGYIISGGTVTTSGDYNIHTFTASGNLTITQSGWTPIIHGTIVGTSTPLCEYLVVAGGGGGRRGNDGGGGGGAGGLLTGTTVLSGTNTITIGAGGAIHTNGSNSSIGAIVVAVGGGSGPIDTGDGTTGGSGGGATTQGGGAFLPGTGTAGQGYPGGTAYEGGANDYGGAGGGAGATGGNATASTSGNGGVGLASSISGASVYYAGGGGGGGTNDAGDGGNGGGGAGAIGGATAVAGTANTGGGGGGAGWSGSYGTPKEGGSGIVIVRYLTNQ